MKNRQLIWDHHMTFNGLDLTINDSLMVSSCINIRLRKGFQDD